MRREGGTGRAGRGRVTVRHGQGDGGRRGVGRDGPACAPDVEVATSASASSSLKLTGNGFELGGGGASSPGCERRSGGMYMGTPCSWRCIDRSVTTSVEGVAASASLTSLERCERRAKRTGRRAARVVLPVDNVKLVRHDGGELG